MQFFPTLFQLSVALGCRRQTNNAVRPTSVTNMLEDEVAKISNYEVTNVTGHHRETSLGHYDRTKMKRRFEIADAITKMEPIAAQVPSTSTVTSGDFQAFTLQSSETEGD